MLRRLIRTGLRRGLVDGSTPWLLVGVGAGMLALLRKVTHELPETVFREPLGAGEELRIRALDPES